MKKNNDTYAIIGLGNPGTHYSNTRHNIGQKIVNQYLDKHNTKYKKQNNLLVAAMQMQEKQIFCLQSTEFLNTSGKSYSEFIKKENIQNNKIILIADDIDIEVGKLSIQKSKSHGGNNGIRSLFNYIDNDPVIRIRIGVGRPNFDGKESFDPEEVSKWVLSKPSKQEENNLKKILEQAILSIDSIIEFGIDFTMNKFNGLHQ
tara:strand:- start:15 stop:620 length:606 start_codon:yes stop_codon:yes gene_type:complete